MDAIFFPKVSDNKSSMEESPIITDKNNSPSLSHKGQKSSNSNLCEPFKAFSSALFMSEYQENDETVISSQSNSNSNKENKKKKILDLNISPSLEKCLTNELLESMADDSSNIKLKKNSTFHISNCQEQGGDNLKITKKLFNKDKDNNSTLYEDNINDGFEYQLKFIENSVHNIFPKSYKTFNNKNNYYNNKNNNHRTSFPYSSNNTRYKNKYYYNNKAPFASIFYPNLISKNANNENNGNNFSNNNYVKNQIISKVQNMKNNENKYDDWICYNCQFLNRGYRKICANCNMYKKK